MEHLNSGDEGTHLGSQYWGDPTCNWDMGGRGGSSTAWGISVPMVWVWGAALVWAWLRETVGQWD